MSIPDSKSQPAPPALGILMLNTRFPRIPGDIGNPASFPFPVRYEVIELATVDRVVTAAGPSADVMNAFVASAERLVSAGVVGLTTSCGFMAIAQRGAFRTHRRAHGHLQSLSDPFGAGDLARKQAGRRADDRFR